MAYTIAFKVKHDSAFYENYFDAKEEKEKFRELAIQTTKIKYRNGYDATYGKV